MAEAAHKATESEISAWEERYNVVLPTDLRNYVTRVNGILDGEKLDWDHESSSFLPLAAMCSESEWSGKEAQPNLFVFADYFISCYWWCVALDNDPHEETPVFIGGLLGKNRMIASSLAEFFDLYMHNPARLHF